MVRSIYACDVGSTRTPPAGRRNRIRGVAFAWARVSSLEPTRVCVSQDIERLARSIGDDLTSGQSVALGFEAPLFFPVPQAAERLSRGRENERSRAFSAPAGLAVAALAVHQAAWLLRELFSRCGQTCEFSVDWTKWPPKGEKPLLFCWEAFVSGSAHSDTHVYDAATAATAFVAAESDLASANAVTAERPISLIGAVALWSGWTTDVKTLRGSTLVIKPDVPYRGVVEPVEPAHVLSQGDC